MINVLLVTTWEKPCGIAEHSAYLKEAVEADGGDIRITPWDNLCPGSIEYSTRTEDFPIVHLNYQAALLSRWTPDSVRYYQKRGRKVVITYHDTGVPNSDICKSLFDVADAFVIHEPADDLLSSLTRPAPLYWRMGVPGPPDGQRYLAFDMPHFWRQWPEQPVLGTIGFPFPWKNYDQLAKVTRDCGWALLLIAPDATEDQIASWRRRNPALHVYPQFIARKDVVGILANCDATAFCYVCHNTGQSAAILQGIAARKPVIALRTCRQFRALYNDALGRGSIHWAETFDDVSNLLCEVPIQRVDPSIVALAEQESWTRVGKKYAALYRRLAV